MPKMSEGVEEEDMEGKMRTINRDKNKLEENSIKSLKHLSSHVNNLLVTNSKCKFLIEMLASMVTLLTTTVYFNQLKTVLLTLLKIGSLLLQSMRSKLLVLKECTPMLRASI